MKLHYWIQGLSILIMILVFLVVVSFHLLLFIIDIIDGGEGGYEDASDSLLGFDMHVTVEGDIDSVKRAGEYYFDDSPYDKDMRF